jgi:nitrate reductase assembly molybdenum cofactor insertion protein NarJ
MSYSKAKLYDSLGGLLQYPQPGFHESLRICLEEMYLAESDGCDHLQLFVDDVADKDIEELEELFTRTFDINTKCALEVGWQLYAENYERGAFIVHMRQALRRLDIAETSELPDHLSQVLRALGRMDEVEANSFASGYVVPAMDKMFSGLKGLENPYIKVLKTIHADVKSRHAESHTDKNGKEVAHG